jgi:hypothetical protein
VQGSDVIAYQPVSVALDGKRELVFRMKVPGGMIAGAKHHFAVERFPLCAWRLLKDRFHAIILKGAAFADKSTKVSEPVRKCEASEHSV